MPIAQYFSAAPDIDTQWTPEGFSTHWQAVNTNDGDTSYIWTPYPNVASDMVNVSSVAPVPEEGGLISQITFAARCRKTVTGSGAPWEKFWIRARFGGIVYKIGTVLSPTTNYVTMTRLIATHPAGGPLRGYHLIGWALGVFHEDTDDSALGQLRVTQLFASVSWTQETRRALRGILTATVRRGRLVVIPE